MAEYCLRRAATGKRALGFTVKGETVLASEVGDVDIVFNLPNETPYCPDCEHSNAAWIEGKIAGIIRNARLVLLCSCLRPSPSQPSLRFNPYGDPCRGNA